MTYLRTHSRGIGRNISIATVVVVVIAILAAAVRFFAPQAFLGLFNGVAKPFWRAEFAVDAGALSSPERLVLDNEDLKRKLDEADVRLASIQYIEKENGELKALFGRASTTPKVLAAVLSRPPYSAYDTIILDIGADYGLSTTSKVYAAGGIPIGRIAEISRDASKAILFSSPGQRYEVLIGSGNLPATAVGRGGGQYEAQLPRGANVAEGDFVDAPSLDSKPFGVVKAVKSDSSELFETVFFASPVNIYGLRWVLVDVSGKHLNP